MNFQTSFVTTTKLTYCWCNRCYRGDYFWKMLISCIFLKQSQCSSTNQLGKKKKKNLLFFPLKIPLLFILFFHFPDTGNWTKYLYALSSQINKQHRCVNSNPRSLALFDLLLIQGIQFCAVVVFTSPKISPFGQDQQEMIFIYLFILLDYVFFAFLIYMYLYASLFSNCHEVYCQLRSDKQFQIVQINRINNQI